MPGTAQCLNFYTVKSIKRFFDINLKTSNWSTESRHKRGYGNNWDKLRVIVLKRDNGICQCNECQGGKVRLKLATEVHHIRPKSKGGTDDLDNLQAINKECHMRETFADQGKIFKPKITVGTDGWPVEIY